MDPSYDARVSHAMNGVLEAERNARGAISDCELKMQALLEQARQQRRNILERAQERIMTLHGRAARSLEQRTAQLVGRRETHEAAQAEDSARLHAAIDRLLERLTGNAEDES
jgi:vacuolar-type H+-ATPase subunit H